MASSEEELARLTATVESFCRLMEGLPARALLEKPWGPRQVLSHLVFWHETYVRQAEAQLTGKGWLLPEGTFNELNAQAVASLATVGVPTLLARLRAANKRLCTLVRQPKASVVKIQLKADSKAWPLGEFLVMVEAHIRRHGEELRKAYFPRGGRHSGATWGS
jgi:hypothetical protein